MELMSIITFLLCISFLIMHSYYAKMEPHRREVSSVASPVFSEGYDMPGLCFIVNSVGTMGDRKPLVISAIYAAGKYGDITDVVLMVDSNRLYNESDTDLTPKEFLEKIVMEESGKTKKKLHFPMKYASSVLNGEEFFSLTDDSFSASFSQHESAVESKYPDLTVVANGNVLELSGTSRNGGRKKKLRIIPVRDEDEDMTRYDLRLRERYVGLGVNLLGSDYPDNAFLKSSDESSDVRFYGNYGDTQAPYYAPAQNELRITTKYLETYKSGGIGSVYLPVPQTMDIAEQKSDVSMRGSVLALSHPGSSFSPWSADEANLKDLMCFAREQKDAGRKLMVIANSGVAGDGGSLFYGPMFENIAASNWSYIIIGVCKREKEQYHEKELATEKNSVDEWQSHMKYSAGFVEFEDLYLFDPDYVATTGGAGSVSAVLAQGIPQTILTGRIASVGGDKRSNFEDLQRIEVAPPVGRPEFQKRIYGSGEDKELMTFGSAFQTTYWGVFLKHLDENLNMGLNYKEKALEIQREVAKEDGKAATLEALLQADKEVLAATLKALV